MQLLFVAHIVRCRSSARGVLDKVLDKRCLGFLEACRPQIFATVSKFCDTSRKVQLADLAAFQLGGRSVVLRSRPERSTPDKSVSRRMVVVMSAPRKSAP